MPDWVKERSTGMKSDRPSLPSCYLKVEPKNDPDLNCLHIVHLGEFLVKRANGSVWHYKKQEDFLQLMFKIESE